MDRDDVGTYESDPDTNKRIRDFLSGDKKEYSKSERDTYLVNSVDSGSVNLCNPESDREEKIDLLKGYGYTSLRVSEGKNKTSFLNLADCSTARLTMVLKKTYENALERLSKQ